MKTTTKTETTIVLDDDKDNRITIHITGHHGVVVSEIGDSEDFERVAEALRTNRYASGDFRVVCADHGYHNAGPCPRCRGDALDAPVVDGEHNGVPL